MSIDIEYLRKHFSSLDTEELQSRLRDGNLVPEAKALAEAELLSRGIALTSLTDDPSPITGLNPDAATHPAVKLGWVFWLLNFPLCAAIGRFFGQAFGVLGFFLVVTIFLISERNERRQIRWGPEIEWLLLLWFGLLAACRT